MAESSAPEPDVVDLLLSQHAQIEELFREVLTTEGELRLAELRLAVLTQAKREERYEFPQLRAAVEPAKRGRLVRAVLAAQKLAPTRPHPGVESAPANLLAGPPMAVVDRVRDAVRNALRDDR